MSGEATAVPTLDLKETSMPAVEQYVEPIYPVGSAEYVEQQIRIYNERRKLEYAADATEKKVKLPAAKAGKVKVVSQVTRNSDMMNLYMTPQMVNKFPAYPKKKAAKKKAA